MIYTGSNEILGIKLGNTDISAIYAGDLLIYPTTVTAWSVTPTQIEMASTGGTENIRIASLSAWTISSSESWITFSQNSGNSGRTTVVATIANNISPARTATITVTDGTNTASIIVSQTGLAFSVSPASIEVFSAATTQDITISSPYAWTIVSSESWITFSQDSGDNGTYTVTASIDSTVADRTATITVDNGYEYSAISVSQSVCHPFVISSITSTIYTVPAGTEHFNKCNFDTTGVYSLSRDSRCQNIQLNFSATTDSLRDVDIQLDFQNAQDNFVRFSECFKDCTKVTSVTIKGMTDYKIVSCYNMFRNCTSLTSVTMDSFIAGLENGNMSSYDYMFAGCSNLVTIDAIDLTRWSNVNNMFSGCTKLENLTITNIKDVSLTNWGLQGCTALTVASIVGIFNALPVTSGSRTITIGTTNKNKLSAAQLAIATDKGWTVN